VYDVSEFLGRGIIAARSGRSGEALKYLEIAAKMDPGNPRVWLWLATAVKTFAQKQQCLETALKLDPSSLVAKTLLERLQQKAVSENRRPKDVVIFTCPACGGKQRFDPDLIGLVCEFCRRVEPLTLADASNAEADLDVGLYNSSGNWAVIESQVSCKACGANLFVPADRTTMTCPFCDSDEVVVVPATPNLVPPTAIGLFMIHSDDVRQLLRKWWPLTFLTPAGTFDPYELSLSPIYLPFWTFDARVQIPCDGQDVHSAQEFSNFDRVIAIDQWPNELYWYEIDIDDYLVYAAHSLPEDKVTKVGPFLLKTLLEYRPAVLAGWQAELYQIALDDAAVQSEKQMRDQAFGTATRRLLFMEPNNMYAQDVRVLKRTYKLILLPVWIARYRFADQTIMVLVNGQTGKIGEERPFTWLVVLLAFLAGSGLLAILVWLYRLFAG
jgi:hypothetical protein